MTLHAVRVHPTHVLESCRSVKFVSQSSWSRMPGVYRLDPTHPLCGVD